MASIFGSYFEEILEEAKMAYTHGRRKDLTPHAVLVRRVVALEKVVAGLISIAKSGLEREQEIAEYDLARLGKKQRALKRATNKHKPVKRAGKIARS